MRRARSLLTLAALAPLACGVEAADPPAQPVPVPFTVSDYYSPDGFWGDGEKRGQLVLTKSCPQRPPGAAGDCYVIDYTPAEKRFAGINWQYPNNNWGKEPGLRLAAGATRVTFKARGARGGEAVSFGVGQTGTPNRYNNPFNQGGAVDLTTAWMPYAIPVRERYDGPDGFIGAFSVSLMAGDSDTRQTIYVDDIRWQP